MGSISTHDAGLLERRLTGDGVKLASDCWRTIKGQHYDAWTSYPEPDLIAAYRAAGVRCRRFGCELFVMRDDLAKASEVDRWRDETRAA